MKLVTNQSALEKEFKRLLRQYKKFYWTTAWAGIQSNPFNDLLANQDKIHKVVVGIHFYQTHPDFIEAFLNHANVRFILRPEGTFHPKLYLFYDSAEKWELLVGSGNFTSGAFTKNIEASVLLTNNDNGSKEVLTEAKKFVENIWLEAKPINETQLDKYRTAWKNHRSKVKSLSGMYGSSQKQPKPIHEVPVINMTWEQFLKKVQDEPKYGPASRIKIISKSRELFNKTNHFNQLSEDERKFIAGVPNKLDESIDWGLFGSMKGSGTFKNRIILNDKNISNALDQIPILGQITRNNYDNYIKYYKKTFSGNYIATATRLLCMKRPDTFICFDSKNKSALCQDFGIKQSEMNYERYWDDIIERIYDSEWWLNPEPNNKQEEQISNARAAFLDSLYYEE